MSSVGGGGGGGGSGTATAAPLAASGGAGRIGCFGLGRAVGGIGMGLGLGAVLVLGECFEEMWLRGGDRDWLDCDGRSVRMGLSLDIFLVEDAGTMVFATSSPGKQFWSVGKRMIALEVFTGSDWNGRRFKGSVI